MSELEKIKRDEYQKKRKETIYYLIALVLLLSLITATFSIIFINLDTHTYVYYQENGSALYHAYLKDNIYYEEDRLNGSHAYVSDLIDHMDIEFRYQSKMEAEDARYQYQYRVDAQLVIKDTKSGAAIYNPVETILGPTIKEYAGQNLLLAPTVEIDYVSYNRKAQAFIDKYRLTNVSARLDVTMYVQVVGMSELFVADNKGQYTIQVEIPLTQNVLKPEVSSTIPTGPQKIVSNPNKGKDLFKVLAIVFGVLDAGAIGYAAFYVWKTRDEHIDYGRKVQKIVTNYKSFIQKIINPFDTKGYQKLEVDTFNAMLEIRDTLQLPILMYENEDRTCTTFMIPVDSRLLYTFEIKVDNYDAIYSPTDPSDDIDAEIEEAKKIKKEKSHNVWDMTKGFFLRFFKTGIAEIDAIDDIEIDIDEIHKIDHIRIGGSHHDDSENEEDIVAEETAEPEIAEKITVEETAESEIAGGITVEETADPEIAEEITVEETAEPEITEEITVEETAEPEIAEEITVEETDEPEIAEPEIAEEIAVEQTDEPEIAEEIAVEQTDEPEIAEEITVEETAEPEITEEITVEETILPEVEETVEADEAEPSEAVTV